MKTTDELKELRGLSFPIGTSVKEGGVNFSLFSKNCLGVELVLFNNKEDIAPSRVIRLDPHKNRTYHYWHVFVPGIKAGQLYGYRIAGPNDPQAGHRFDGDKILLDPYAKAIAVPAQYDRDSLKVFGPTETPAMKSVVADLRQYRWGRDHHPRRSFTKTIIYEMHVGGFTKSKTSKVSAEKRGTYAGLIEKIPYLVDLGITAVELLPVFQFDKQDCPKGLVNYWGYSPVSFFAVHQGYSTSEDPLVALDEFRDMVKALHKAGIEVILDVVFNHTAEGGANGPTLSFKGIDNKTYYSLEHDKSQFANYSGTGNTLNASHPIVRRMIIDSLHFWVKEMHVDGFRFDLASILSRDEQGKPIENPPLLWDIESDPILAGTKLIAEAWDAVGLYQVGSFIGDSWKEWNGKFRDDVRSFLNGDVDTVSRFASRLLGSPDIFGHENREAEQSINFITCHDGFTLNDVVTYNNKNNQANGEDNRDGSNDNLSWNFGTEGPTDDSEVELLRNRQVKNMLTMTLLSVGTPMILMGDEVRRTQLGNNNAYCQDNEVSWLDWTLKKKHSDIFHFLKNLIQVRLQREAAREEFGMTLIQLLSQSSITWHGIKLNEPDWSYHSHTIAITVQSLSGRTALHYMINAYSAPLDFELPPANCNWRKWIDTGLPSPDDICPWSKASEIQGSSYHVGAHSIAILVAKEAKES